MPKPKSITNTPKPAKTPKTPPVLLDFDRPRDAAEHRRLDLLIDAYLDTSAEAAAAHPDFFIPGDLDAAFRLYLDIYAEFKDAERRLQPIKDALTAAIHRAGIDVLTVSGIPIRRIEMPRSTIDRERLVALGVLPSTIVEATVTKTAPQLRIGKESE